MDVRNLHLLLYIDFAFHSNCHIESVKWCILALQLNVLLLLLMLPYARSCVCCCCMRCKQQNWLQQLVYMLAVRKIKVITTTTKASICTPLFLFWVSRSMLFMLIALWFAVYVLLRHIQLSTISRCTVFVACCRRALMYH